MGVSTVVPSDRDAGFLELVSGRTGHLYRSACLLTGGDTHLAEDMVQETLARMYVLWRARASWLTGRSRIDHPGAYAQTVLVRSFLAHRRRRASSELPVGETPESAGRDTDDALRVTLLAALRRLPPKDRAVLVLRHWEDRSIEETAEALRMSSGAVRTRTTRALARMRDLLGDSLSESVTR